MQEKCKYFKIYIDDNELCVKNNKANRRTVVTGAPIFLSERVAWNWLINNYKKEKT